MRISKVESERRDQAIKGLYSQGKGCRVIASELGLGNSNVYRRLKKMGLIRSKGEANRLKTPGTPSVDFFSSSKASVNLPRAALGIAIRWFLLRGYMVSLPVDPTHYDLVVESDSGLKRVQVKTTTFKDRTSWRVNIGRVAYDGAASVNSGGKRRKVSYTADQIDLFFILTADGETYLVPQEAVPEVKTISLSNKYAKYKHADVVELVDTQP